MKDGQVAQMYRGLKIFLIDFISREIWGLEESQSEGPVLLPTPPP